MAKTFSLDKKHITLLENLSQAMGISGDEGEVRALILEEIHPYIKDHQVDALGNLLATRTGSARNRLKVMVAAHMDEVGFMIAADDGEGIFRFEINGGIDVRQLAGKAVIVGKDHIPGVIGARPIHLTTSSDRQNKIPLNNLRIDIGPGTNNIKPGDRAVFATRFQRVGPSMVGKALDDRLGVAVLIELLKNSPPNIDLQAAFTVQEESGLRGARVAVFSFKPDLAIVIDSTPANDLPAWDDTENLTYNTRLGAGPAIYTADGATLSDPRLLRLVVQTAEKQGIPYQLRQPGGGGTDAGAIHKQVGGIPTVAVSIPSRYAHTAVGMARINDFIHTYELLKETLQSIQPDILAQERK
jgi:putative aminopeptidase FrvX